MTKWHVLSFWPTQTSLILLFLAWFKLLTPFRLKNLPYLLSKHLRNDPSIWFTLQAMLSVLCYPLAYCIVSYRSWSLFLLLECEWSRVISVFVMLLWTESTDYHVTKLKLTPAWIMQQLTNDGIRCHYSNYLFMTCSSARPIVSCHIALPSTALPCLPYLWSVAIILFCSLDLWT